MVEQIRQSAAASDRDIPVAARAHRSPLRRLVCAARDALDQMLLWHERRRQRRSLELLSEELLKDIGLTRLAADEECRKLPWRR